MINLKISVQAKIKNCQDTQLAIPTIYKVKVWKYLSSVDVRRATDTNNIGARLLKLAASHIAEDITLICNSSINSNCFPDKWKG